MSRIKTHPGVILKEDFMVPLGLSARGLALKLKIPANRVTAIINGTRAVSADTAIKLGRHFKTTPELWLNLQQAHDLSAALAAEARRPRVSRTTSARMKSRRQLAAA